MKHFKFLIGDVNYLEYGAKWYRQLDDLRFHVIELINMWDATGEYEQDKYNVSLVEIDIETISKNSLQSIWESCGYGKNKPDNVLQLVEAISSYGQYAPMGEWQGNNYKELMKQAKQESRLLDDSEYHESRLERPINRIGSTAREYSQGDTNSALLRGLFSGDKSAHILGIISFGRDATSLLESLDKTEQEITLDVIKQMKQ